VAIHSTHQSAGLNRKGKLKPLEIGVFLQGKNIMKNDYKKITTEENIKHRIFEEMNDGTIYQTEIFRLMNNIGITIEDIEVAGIDFILSEELGINFIVSEEEDRNTRFENKIIVFLLNSIELGYRDFLNKNNNDN